LAVTVRLTGTGTGRLVCELRDGFTNTVIEHLAQEVTVKGAETSVVFKSSATLVAKAFTVVRLLDARGAVIDFGAGHTRPTFTVPLTLCLDAETIDAPEAIRGTVTLPADSPVCSVALSLYDAQGRVRAAQSPRRRV
jgi:hypothetical protein